MPALRTAAATVLVALALLLGAGPVGAQTTTTTAPNGVQGTTLPVTGSATAQPDQLAQTGVELLPVVDAGIALIAVGLVLAVGAELAAGRRRRSLWSC